MDIRIKNLSKNYGPQTAVNGISFEVKTGEILGFLGPNGAGKTTTMKMITNYIAIGGGDILIGGKSVKNHPDEIKKHVGYLPEHNPLYLDMPIMDYLHFCGALQGVAKHQLNARVQEMIRITGLDREKHKKIGELSKGYRQRVGLAQAIIHDPEILILDEPTTGLDPNQIVEIRNLIRELGREKTVILSTHILPEVEATCDRILIINQGNIVADGTADTLRQQMQGLQVHHVQIEGGERAEILTALNSLDGVVTVSELETSTNRFEITSTGNDALARAIFNRCVKQQWILTELTPLETKLEDIFRDLTMN